MPSWAEIKAVLDSPYVSADKKNRIMQAYDKDSFNFNDEAEDYAKKYLQGYADHDLDLNWDFELGGDNGLQTAYDSAYAHAEAGLDAGQAQEKLGTDAKDRAKSALDATTPPAPGSAGARNSNELLDRGEPACYFLCQWIDQVWNKRPAGGTLDYMREIWGRYNRDRNIDFQKFLADVDDLNNAHKANDDAMNVAETELDMVFGEWKGQSATAARLEFEKIQPGHRKLQEQIDGAAKLVPRTASAVFDAIKTKVDSVLGLYRTTVAHAPLEMANKVVKIARKETDRKEDLLDVADWVDGVFGSNLSERLQSDDGGLNDANRDYAYDLCARWVANSFTPEFRGLLDAFTNHCETAHATVERQFGALADYLTGYHNEFTEPTHVGSRWCANTAGEPPVDPTTGEAIKDAGRPETLSVQAGDNRIDLSEPDSYGRMHIKIDDGHGDTKSFRLGWGEGTQHGAHGTPAGVADPAPRAADPHYPPGPDGKIHIQDGDLWISAERPQAPDGPTVVIVDDGTGRPTTYTPGGNVPPSGTTGEHATGSPAPTGTGQQFGDGFAAPDGIDAGHAFGAEPTAMGSTEGGSPGAATGGAHVETSGVGASGTGAEAGDAETDTGTDTGSGTDMSQQTTPASASGSLFSTPEDPGTGAIGGRLGESGFGSGTDAAGALEAGALAGVSVGSGVVTAQPGPTVVGTAPPAMADPTTPDDHRAALGGSGFGGPAACGMGMLGGGFEDDEERGSRAYRVDGGIFNTSGADGRISGSLDDEDPGDRF